MQWNTLKRHAGGKGLSILLLLLVLCLPLLGFAQSSSSQSSSSASSSDSQGSKLQEVCCKETHYIAGLWPDKIWTRWRINSCDETKGEVRASTSLCRSESRQVCCMHETKTGLMELDNCINSRGVEVDLDQCASVVSACCCDFLPVSNEIPPVPVYWEIQRLNRMECAKRGGSCLAVLWKEWWAYNCNQIEVARFTELDALLRMTE